MSGHNTQAGDREVLCRRGHWTMNKGSIQTIAIVLVAIALVYSLIILERDGTLQDMWATLTSGSFGGFPL